MTETKSSLMIIEDESEIRTCLRELFEMENWNVTEAETCDRALELLRQGATSPRVLLLDYQLPGMHPAEFRRLQKEDPKLAEIPVVLISADTRIEPHSGQIEASYYAKKPFEADELVAAVTRLGRVPEPGCV